MSKMTISGPINAEALEFAQSILSDLQGHKWIKDAIKAGLAHGPGDAHDGAALIFKCMAMRVGEIDGPTLDDR